MSQTVIGLDIGHYSVKALRLNVSYRGFVAEGYDEEVLDTVVTLPDNSFSSEEGVEEGFSEDELDDAIHDAEDAALHTALGLLRDRGALDGEMLSVSFPPDLVLSGRLAFPFTDPKQLTPIVPIEFEEMVPVSIDELLVEHHLVGPSTDQPGLNDVLVTAVKREDLEVFLELWQEGGIDPHYVVMGDAAMLNLASYLLDELEGPYAIVDVGHRYTRVACVEPDIGENEKSQRLGYVRSFQYGGHDLTQALAEVLGCSYTEAEDFKHHKGQITVDTAIIGVDDVRASDAMKRSSRGLVRELRRTLQAHLTERRVAVERIFLCGGTSRLKGLAAHLHQELGIPVELLPVAGEELAGLDMKGAQSAGMAQALALSLREVVPSPSTVGINFRSGAYSHKGAQGWFRERLIGLIIVMACFFCALGSMFATEYYAITKEEAALKETLDRASIQLFGEPLAPDKIAKKLSGADDEQGLIPNRSARDYFIEVSNRTPEGADIQFTDVEVDLYRQLIKIKATTTAASVVDSYVESLEAHECFKGKVTKGGTESVGDRVRFDMTIAPECPGARKDDKKKKG